MFSSRTILNPRAKPPGPNRQARRENAPPARSNPRKRIAHRPDPDAAQTVARPTLAGVAQDYQCSVKTGPLAPHKTPAQEPGVALRQRKKPAAGRCLDYPANTSNRSRAGAACRDPQHTSGPPHEARCGHNPIDRRFWRDCPDRRGNTGAHPPSPPGLCGASCKSTAQRPRRSAEPSMTSPSLPIWPGVQRSRSKTSNRLATVCQEDLRMT